MVIRAIRVKPSASLRFRARYVVLEVLRLGFATAAVRSSLRRAMLRRAVRLLSCALQISISIWNARTVLVASFLGRWGVLKRDKDATAGLCAPIAHGKIVRWNKPCFHQPIVMFLNHEIAQRGSWSRPD